ncbi:MAG: adenylate/guanylate cyclase domain-containing protein [Actinobacteria bacterium]|nr:adenylate/guanylate cyclase domain-containing protein [Actinomycetota bacterium]
MERPETRYATSGDVHIAYQVCGDGDTDVVIIEGFVSHLDEFWAFAPHRAWVERLARFARVIRFDKRGVGLSDRSVQAPTLEQRVADLLAVLDAAGSSRATLYAISEGAPTALLCAATHPDRVTRLILHGGMARCTEAPDYPWAPPAEALIEAATELIVPYWDEPVTMETLAPTLAQEDAERAAWSRRSQAAASPQTIRQLYAIALDIDVRDVLPLVHQPVLLTHRRGDMTVTVHASEYLAEHLPDARLVVLPGQDHLPYIGDTAQLLQEVEAFVTGRVPALAADRVLATVAFTDIVNSTEQLQQLGDRAWRELLDRHHEVVRRHLDAQGGVERKTLGDGFLATFPGPAAAVRFGRDVVAALEPVGLDVRIGVHTGEVEHQGDDLAGIAVHLAARVVDAAGSGEVLISRTVRDLIAGSGVVLEDRGEHELKGIDEPWRLYRVI